jgi:hypothetical protein
VLVQESVFAIDRNIFYGEETSVGLGYLGDLGSTHSCNVFFANAQGPVGGTALSPSDVVLDPIFCDAMAGDFTISLQSPAAPSNSACNELIGAFPTNCDIPPPPPPPPPVIEPVILSVQDVPDDQGFKVRVRWERADYDAPGQPYLITGYGIYRRQNGNASAAPPSRFANAEQKRGETIDGWDYLATVPARGDEIYQYVAPTLCNKPHNGDPCWSVFFVSAMTSSPFTYFDSKPDSGYSIDNLPPGPPGAVVVLATPDGNEINWEPSSAPDVVTYQVYRSTSTIEEPSPEWFVHAGTAPGWLDHDGVAGSVYTVFAVDASGNMSEGASQGTPTAVEQLPSQNYLSQNAPNPFNPTTMIEFGVAFTGAAVRLDIFDVTGRRIRTLVDGSRSAGVWRESWDGRTNNGSRVSSGVYFYRLRVGDAEFTRRMTLVE